MDIEMKDNFDLLFYIKRELLTLIQGCLIAMFFLSVTAAGSYSSYEGEKYIHLFEALLGFDYLLMGTIGYTFFLSVVLIKHEAKADIYRSKVFWYAKNLLLFPVIGFIAPALVFTVINLFYHFLVSDNLDEIALTHWPLVIAGMVAAYIFLICLPSFINWLGIKPSESSAGFAIMGACILLVIFITEKLFFGSIYSFYIFIFFLFILLGCIFYLIRRRR